MTTFNQLDTGASHPWPKAHVGQLLGSIHVEGSKTTFWPRGRKQKTQDVELFVRAWQGYGTTAGAGSGLANQYLSVQLEELFGNPDLQPLFIRWTQTAESGAGLAASELHDGWYVVQDFEDPYTVAVVQGGVLRYRLTVEFVAPPPPARIGYAYSTAPLSTTFIGASATPLYVFGFPVGSTVPATLSFNRTGGEGAIPCVHTPVTNPVPFALSSTIANWWLGGVRVWDTINTGSNPVPSGGTYASANWVEVFAPDRAYQGDAFITNGLVGLLLQTGGSNAATLYLWSTVTSAWVSIGSFQLISAGSVATSYGYTIERLGFEEAAVSVHMGGVGNATGAYLVYRFRLQRGSHLVRYGVTSLGEDYTAVNAGPSFVPTVGNPIYIANPGMAVDVNTEIGTGVTAQRAVSTAYGYIVCVPPQSGAKYIYGWVSQNQASQAQPAIIGGATPTIISGDGPAPGATKYGGFYAYPFDLTANLVAQAESGTLGTGWSSIADANGSGGNTAKVASGTASTNADLFGTAWQPGAVAVDVWFRVRVTSAAGSALEMTLGLWDATSSAFVTGGSTTFRANQAATTYGWLKANSTSPVTLPAGHNVQFRAVTALTLGTDWFIDEAFLAPATITTVGGVTVNGPLDQFRQLLGDRDMLQVAL